MTRVAGVDGTRGGWALVAMDENDASIREVAALRDALNGDHFDIVAVDVPIGLLDAYEIGGRVCDRAARKLLGKRGSSVFAAPVRSVLGATSFNDACLRSRGSSLHDKAISKQTYEIVRKIREVDDLLKERPELRRIVYEVHPEVCFRELAHKDMGFSKHQSQGREERRHALARVFRQLPEIEQAGRAQGIRADDVLDAAVACWSACRIAAGQAHSVPVVPPVDSSGLPMAIWV